MANAYGYPDYSYCLLEQQKIRQWLDQEKIDRLKSIINMYSKNIKYAGKGRGTIWALLNLLLKIFHRDHEGWALGEDHLGSRKKKGIFY